MANNTHADRARIRAARARAERRQKNRVDHYKHYKRNKKNARELSRARSKKAKQMRSLKRQGRHADLAEARAQYDIYTEKQKKSLKAAKGHARRSYGSGAGRGNFKGVLRQTPTPKGKKAPTVRTVNKPAGKGQIVEYSAPPRKGRASAPSVGSSKKKPKSTTPKIQKLTKEQYKNLVKNRSQQSSLNYNKYKDDDAKRKKSAGQKLFNDYDKKIKNSQYSYRSHVAAMKRRGKKATAATYAKFKRYNGI